MSTLEVPSLINEFTPAAVFRVLMPGETEKREFRQRILTAGVMAAFRRIEKLYREDNADALATALRLASEAARAANEPAPEYIGIDSTDMCYYLMDDRSLLNSFMREIYEGNHDGIDWHAADGVSVLTLLQHFFLRWFGTRKKSSNDSSPLSATSDTSSTLTNAEPSSPAASTSGSTKRPRGRSRKAPPTTTTS